MDQFAWDRKESKGQILVDDDDDDVVLYFGYKITDNSLKMKEQVTPPKRFRNVGYIN
jgi:hypothetical protein